MSLFDDASLVITPSGYKEGKLYSIKPTDGSGDLSVTRATTATRVNSAGLVEVVPYNLLTYSEALTPNYTFNQCSITSNQTGPNGVNNAKRITNGATTTDVYFEQSIGITNNVYTWSVYVKKGTDTAATIKPVHVGIGGDVSLMTFTFSTETITTSGAITTSGFTKLSNGWYRIYCSVPITSSVVSLRGRFGNTNTPNVYNDWFGAQLVEGSSAKDYYPTTTRLNIPRLDYTNGSCPSILVEPQRTNLALSSEDFTNATYWNSTGDMVTTANQAISPSGLQNADLFFDSGSRNKFVSSPVSSYLTFSCYFKRVDVTNVLITASDFYSGDVSATFNLVALTSSSAISGDWSNNSTKIESVGNGWYRCSLTALRGAGGSGVQYRIECAEVEKSFYAWGYQLEAGSYATSYIPTTSASVTRNADVFSVSLPNTDMTFCAYLELAEPTLGSNTGDWLQIYNNVSILGRGYGYAQAVGFADAYVLGATASSSRKIIWKQESGTTAKIFLDGVLVATSTTGTYSNPFNRLGIFGEHLSKPAKINMFTFFNENLTDAQCIELTTL